MSIRGPELKPFAAKRAGPDAKLLKTAFEAEGMFLQGHGIRLRGLPTAEVNRYYDQSIDKAPWNRNLRNEVLSDLYNESRGAYFQGDYAEALDLIRRATEIYPESYEAHNDYALMLLKMNRPDAAVEELLRALTLNPEFIPARRSLAMIYASRGQVDKALAQWKEAFALDPNNVPTLVGYGVYLAKLRPGTKAVEYLRKAYREDPEDPDVVHGYALVTYLSGDVADARQIVLKGGNYYKGNPFFEKLRSAILGGS